MTWKKAILRGLLGIPIGLALSVVIFMSISAIAGNGSIIIAAPEIVARTGSEFNGALLQFIVCAVIGASFAFSSAFFEFPNWGILKQTALHFAVTFLTYFPIAWLCYWIPHTITGSLIFAGLWVVLYIAIWFAQSLFWRKRLREINQRLD